ncbi:unnamed protein product [Didymodactylos carnosus]|uniref:Uncharacterized protein n=1 Tax=Didymodactylos carnosus TaxID=1234261 RepID=A0A8S2FIK2_9BILA|nr:unnamed protein product [Didymodactylos carnosus]CAF4269060.1 unnamed protein product [Didymodactylos carnosus]
MVDLPAGTGHDFVDRLHLCLYSNDAKPSVLSTNKHLILYKNNQIEPISTDENPLSLKMARHIPLMGIQALMKRTTRSHLTNSVHTKSITTIKQEQFINEIQPLDDDNYDMTVLQVNKYNQSEDDDLPTSSQKKKIPRWARKLEL